MVKSCRKISQNSVDSSLNILAQCSVVTKKANITLGMIKKEIEKRNGKKKIIPSYKFIVYLHPEYGM